MRILAIDLGIKSLGTCVSDESNSIAIPVENYIFDREDYPSAIERVIELVDKYKVTKILLGYPLKTTGKKSEATFMVDNFYSLLMNRTQGIKVTLVDERYSTKRGIELLSTKYDKHKVIELKDMAAAYVMLYDHLLFIG